MPAYFNDYPGQVNTAAPAGALPGLAPTEGSNTPYGMVPSVPSPGSTSLDALLANINNLGNLSTLAKGVTDINVNTAMTPYTSALPGLSSAYGQGMGNIQSLLKGQVPADVITKLQQESAERGIATGQGPGSPNTNAAYLRALGLTSLDLENTGLKNLSTLMGTVPKGNTFDPSTMLTTPDAAQMWKYLASVLAAAPSPGKKAAADLNAFNTGLGGGFSGGGGMTPLQSFLNSMDQWAKQGWSQSEYGQPTPTRTGGFPAPTTTAPVTGVPYGMSSGEADAWYAMGLDPYALDSNISSSYGAPSSTDYGTVGGMMFDPYSLEPIGDLGGGDYGMY